MIIPITLWYRETKPYADTYTYSHFSDEHSSDEYPPSKGDEHNWLKAHRGLDTSETPSKVVKWP